MELLDKLTDDEIRHIQNTNPLYDLINIKSSYKVVAPVRPGLINTESGVILTILPLTIAYVARNTISNNKVPRDRIRYLVSNNIPFPITHVYKSGHVCYGSLYISSHINLTSLFEPLNVLLLNNDRVQHTDMKLQLSYEQQNEISEILSEYNFEYEMTNQSLLLTDWLWVLGHKLINKYGIDKSLTIMTKVFNIIFV